MKRIDPVPALVLALCIARLWLMPLPSSFWVDEMGTVFVVRHGAADPTLKDVPQVADSIYYLVPAIAQRLAGLSEIGYRLFSAIAMALGLFAVGRLAVRLIHPDAGWFVVFACLASSGFNFEAADARPYALGTAALSVGLLKLVRWLDSGRWRDALFFAVCAGALWWVHLVFWPFYPVFIVYAGYRIWRGESKARLDQMAAVTAIVALACVPVAIRALSLLHGAGAHVVAPRPSWGALVSQLKPGQILGAGVLAFVAGRRLKWPLPGSAVLVLAWWLLDPLILFAFSRAGGVSLFVARYLYLAIPGAALMAGLVADLFLPARFWKPLAIGLGCAALAFGGHWSRLWPAHQNSDWRTAAAHLREWRGGGGVPVICPSPFIEARPPVWTPDYPVSGFLYAQLAVYPVAGRVFPFPFEDSPEAERYAHRLSAGELRAAGRFAIYGIEGSVDLWSRRFAEQPEFRTWERKRIGLYGDVEIVAFRTLYH